MPDTAPEWVNDQITVYHKNENSSKSYLGSGLGFYKTHLLNPSKLGYLNNKDELFPDFWQDNTDSTWLKYLEVASSKISKIQIGEIFNGYRKVRAIIIELDGNNKTVNITISGSEIEFA